MKIGIVGSDGYIAGYLLSHYQSRDYVEEILCIDMSEKADRFLDLEHPEAFDYDADSYTHLTLTTIYTVNVYQATVFFKHDTQELPDCLFYTSVDAAAES